MLDHGVWAEVKVGDEHLRLFAERNALSLTCCRKLDCAFGVSGRFEQAKERAAARAQQYLTLVVNLELPPLRWKESRSP